MKIAVFQLNTAYNQLKRNRERIEAAMASRKASLYIAPELFNTGYELDSVRERARNRDEMVSWASSLARKYSCTFIPGSFAEPKGEKVVNTLSVFGPDGEIAAVYSKIHLFSLTGEEKIFEAGSTPALVEIRGMKFGLAVCYDLRFPELFRFYRSRGADGVIVVANWPKARIGHWKALGKARSIENAFFTIGVNRKGVDAGIDFNGNSFCFSPAGEDLLKGAQKSLATAVVDAALVKESRRFLDSFMDRRLNFDEEGL
ncbi:MAG TPA: nitrilase-related carbon-nitrogen hydrolase [Candidatus Mcinerneyibacteriales bacterium]|nr:nitrilase-related carbon-nitrogen hydrolase [Candidatus Mcinerneyibacteriales bacterium]